MLVIARLVSSAAHAELNLRIESTLKASVPLERVIRNDAHVKRRCPQSWSATAPPFLPQT